MSVQSDSVCFGYSCLKKISTSLGIFGILVPYFDFPINFYVGLNGEYWILQCIMIIINMLLVYGVSKEEPIILKIWLLLKIMILIAVSELSLFNPIHCNGVADRHPKSAAKCYL